MASLEGQFLGEVQSDGQGELKFTLVTDDEMVAGVYEVSVGDAPLASTNFTIDSSLPVRQPQAVGVVLRPPYRLYLPLVEKNK